MKKTLLFFLLSQASFGQHLVKDLIKDYKTWKQKQWSTEQIFKYNGFGIVQQNLQQQSFSQNQFTGYGFAALGNKVIDRPKYELGVERYLGLMPFFQSENGTANSYSINTVLARHYLRKVNNKISLGAQVAFSFSGRFGPEYDNNSFATEVFTSLRPKIRYKTDFRFLKRSYGLDYSLSAAVGSIGFWTPTFTSNFTNNKIGIFLPNSYNAIDSRVFLRFPHKKRIQSISPLLGYGWNLQTLTPSKYPNVTNGTHTIYIIANLHKIK